ncbi:hypothetical protein Q1695_012221 [Nippostrongylus brasiliensis]|nr:hypothetical protein Q1695_012221 [Nippostrongylus brasiliensis]
MFSSFFNSAKDVLAEAAANSSSGSNGNARPQPPQPPPSAQGGNSGADLLGGLLQAVGKSLSDGGQQAPQQPPQPAQSNVSQAKSGQGLNLSPEDMALISKGLGAIGGDFWSGLMNAAKEVSQSLNTQHQAQNNPQGKCYSRMPHSLITSKRTILCTFHLKISGSQTGLQLSQDDIARITSGLGSLVGTIKDRTFGAPVDEDEVAKVDSQGGKVQLSSMSEGHGAAGGDFLSGLMNMAKDVGKAMSDQKQMPSTPHGTPAVDAHQQTSPQLKPEDIARITAGLGFLVETVRDKAFKTDAEEKPAVKADANSEKVAQPTPSAEASADSKGGDFFSGLMNVAKDVGKAIGEQNSQAPGNNGSTTNAPTQNSQQLSQDDIAKITAGLGSLVGTLGGKATEYFKKPSAEDEPKSSEKGKEVVVDDVEEEIGKVVLPGYTSAVKKD